MKKLCRIFTGILLSAIFNIEKKMNTLELITFYEQNTDVLSKPIRSVSLECEHYIDKFTKSTNVSHLCHLMCISANVRGAKG